MECQNVNHGTQLKYEDNFVDYAQKNCDTKIKNTWAKVRVGLAFAAGSLAAITCTAALIVSGGTLWPAAITVMTISAIFFGIGYMELLRQENRKNKIAEEEKDFRNAAMAYERLKQEIPTPEQLREFDEEQLLATIKKFFRLAEEINSGLNSPILKISNFEILSVRISSLEKARERKRKDFKNMAKTGAIYAIDLVTKVQLISKLKAQKEYIDNLKK